MERRGIKSPGIDVRRCSARNALCSANRSRRLPDSRQGDIKYSTWLHQLNSICSWLHPIDIWQEYETWSRGNGLRDSIRWFFMKRYSVNTSWIKLGANS